MGVDRSAQARHEPWAAPWRRLAWAVALGLLAVVAAAAVGPAHFSGPRWLVHISAAHTRGHGAVVGVPHHSPRPQAFPAWLLWIAAGIAAVVIVALLVRLLRRGWRLTWRGRSRREPVSSAPHVGVTPRSEPEREPDAPVVRSGIERALEVLGEQREPADAVVRAWLGVQEAAEASGVARSAAETPSEFTSRVVRRVVVDDRPLHTLLRLYLRTRFGDHPVGPDDVTAVRTALQDLVSAWPVSTSRAR